MQYGLFIIALINLLLISINFFLTFHLFFFFCLNETSSIHSCCSDAVFCNRFVCNIGNLISSFVNFTIKFLFVSIIILATNWHQIKVGKTLLLRETKGSIKRKNVFFYFIFFILDFNDFVCIFNFIHSNFFFLTKNSEIN